MLDLLSGLRVVSFNHFLLGPMGIQALADLGADVIAVESTDGAWQRHWAGGDIWPDGHSALFLAANRNKRSLALDLKSATGREIALKLVDSADVVAENFRPGVMEKLGLGYERLQGPQARPDLRLGLGLRPRRALCRQARAGPAGAGAVRHDGHHRPGGHGPAPGRRLRHRPSRRRAPRHGHPGRRRAPAAHGAGLPGRRQPDAVGARPAGGVAGGLAQRAGEAAGQRLQPRGRLVLRRPLRGLCHQGRASRAVAVAPLRSRRGDGRAAARRASRTRTAGRGRTRSAPSSPMS